MMKERLRIADLCQKIGLGIEYIKKLFEGRSLTAKSFSFFSPEHKQKFKAEDINLKIEKEPENSEKLRLNLNGVNIMDWFRDKYNSLTMGITNRIKPNPVKRGRSLYFFFSSSRTMTKHLFETTILIRS